MLSTASGCPGPADTDTMSRSAPDRVASATANQEAGDMSFDGTEIDQLLERAVAAGTYTGVAAIVVDRDGLSAMRRRGRPRRTRCSATRR
jgi:hypothetical protein